MYAFPDSIPPSFSFVSDIAVPITPLYGIIEYCAIYVYANNIVIEAFVVLISDATATLKEKGAACICAYITGIMAVRSACV